MTQQKHSKRNAFAILNIYPPPYFRFSAQYDTPIASQTTTAVSAISFHVMGTDKSNMHDFRATWAQTLRLVRQKLPATWAFVQP